MIASELQFVVKERRLLDDALNLCILEQDMAANADHSTVVQVSPRAIHDDLPMLT